MPSSTFLTPKSSYWEKEKRLMKKNRVVLKIILIALSISVLLSSCIHEWPDNDESQAVVRVDSI